MLSRWILTSILLSSTAFAKVSFEEKQLRVQSLMGLSKVAPQLAIEAYHRELGYERLGLSTLARAKSETNLLAAKVREQVTLAYEAALQKHQDPEVARSEVSAAIARDLELSAPEFKEELTELAQATLTSIDEGGSSRGVELINIEEAMLVEVEKRQAFLNAEIELISPPATDANKKEYATKSELMKALVSDEESTRWVSTGYQTLKSAEITRTDSEISMQLKFSFLGVAVEAGPSISFKREYSTTAIVLAEGMHPVLYNDGNFDYWKRDSSNKIVKRNGVEQKRFIAFYCEANMDFATNYAGAGGFKVLGIGGSAKVTKTYSNSVSLTSRRVALPEYVAGKSMTIKYAAELCHKDFLAAKYSNSMTVSQSLNLLMKNMVAGIEFAHPKTKCAVDSQCINWFNNEIISLVKINNYPRCREEDSREKFYSCQLRGLEGQGCAVFENGKRTSSGEWEYVCDVGLKCVKTESATYFLGYTWTYAKGECRIINKKTYKRPY